MTVIFRWREIARQISNLPKKLKAYSAKRQEHKILDVSGITRKKVIYSNHDRESLHSISERLISAFIYDERFQKCKKLYSKVLAFKFMQGSINL